MESNRMPSLFFMGSSVMLRAEFWPDCSFQSQVYACPLDTLFSVPHLIAVAFVLFMTKNWRVPHLPFLTFVSVGKICGISIFGVMDNFNGSQSRFWGGREGIYTSTFQMEKVGLETQGLHESGNSVAWCQDLLRIAALLSSGGQRPRKWLNILPKTKKVCPRR